MKAKQMAAGELTREVAISNNDDETKKEIEKILLRLIPKIKEKNRNLLEARKKAINEHTAEQIHALRNSQTDANFVEEFLPVGL